MTSTTSAPVSISSNALTCSAIRWTLLQTGATRPSLVSALTTISGAKFITYDRCRPAATARARQLARCRTRAGVRLPCTERRQSVCCARRLLDQVLSRAAVQLERHDDRQHAIQHDVSEQPHRRGAV